MFDSIRKFFAPPAFADEEQNRSASLLNFITLANFVIALITIGFGYANSTNLASTTRSVLIQSLPLLIALIIAQILLRSGRVWLASISFGALLWISQTVNAYISGGTASYSLFNYVLSVMVFGLLLGRRYAIGVAILSLFSAFTMFALDNNGLLPVSINRESNASAIGLFTFLFMAFLATTLLSLYLQLLDESVKKLRKANQALEESGALLEKRVADRTRALETSIEVSRRLSTILDEKQLVTEVVEQVQRAFNYYHAHIYLLNETDKNLVMAGGTGEAGKLMLSRGHKIPMGKGLVGHAASTNSVILVRDTSQDPDWLPNPLLPETRSEIAVPISLGTEILGVLDVQQNTADGLGDSDADLLQSIAYQVAVALKNASSYSSARQLAERETVINTIGRKIQNTVSVEQALQVAVRELGQALSVRDSRVILDLPESLMKEDRS